MCEHHCCETQEHGHKHKHGASPMKRVAVAFAVTAAVMLFPVPFVLKIAIFLAAYLLSGGDVLLRALKNIIKGENLSKDDFDQLVQLGKTKIQEMIEGVKNNSFPIQPKKTYSSKGSLNDRSCDRCSYRDICYRKDEDYIILPKVENNKNNNVED